MQPPNDQPHNDQPPWPPQPLTNPYDGEQYRPQSGLPPQGQYQPGQGPYPYPQGQYQQAQYPPGPYPYTNPYNPNWAEAERLRAAAVRSYLTPAIITLILYIIFWLPGLIVNIVYLASANETKRLSGGRKPEGYGCLVSMLVFFIAVPAVFFVFYVMIFAIGMGM